MSEQVIEVDRTTRHPLAAAQLWVSGQRTLRKGGLGHLLCRMLAHLPFMTGNHDERSSA